MTHSSVLRRRRGLEGCQHGLRVPGDDRQQGASWSFWGSPSALPMFDRVEAEPENSGECRLRHSELIANRFYVDLLRNVSLEPFPLAGEKEFDVAQAIHHLVKLRLHQSPPIRLKDRVGPLL